MQDGWRLSLRSSVLHHSRDRPLRTTCRGSLTSSTCSRFNVFSWSFLGSSQLLASDQSIGPRSNFLGHRTPYASGVETGNSVKAFAPRVFCLRGFLVASTVTKEASP